jgi:hypothetical protein
MIQKAFKTIPLLILVSFSTNLSYGYAFYRASLHKNTGSQSLLIFRFDKFTPTSVAVIGGGNIQGSVTSTGLFSVPLQGIVRGHNFSGRDPGLTFSAAIPNRGKYYQVDFILETKDNFRKLSGVATSQNGKVLAKIEAELIVSAPDVPGISLMASKETSQLVLSCTPFESYANDLTLSIWKSNSENGQIFYSAHLNAGIPPRYFNSGRRPIHLSPLSDGTLSLSNPLFEINLALKETWRKGLKSIQKAIGSFADYNTGQSVQIITTLDCRDNGNVSAKN